jgi:restriction endonuclease S subunit
MGYSFRSKIQPVKTGTVPVLQIKDLSEKGEVSLASLDRIELSDFKETHVIQKNDIIFRSRGFNANSFLVPATAGSLVLAAPLFRIRVTDRSVLPAYINWYISQSAAQTYLGSVAEGTTQKMVNKQSLANLPVMLPPSNIQATVVEIAKMAARENELCQEIARKRSKLVTTQLLDLIKEK